VKDTGDLEQTLRVDTYIVPQAAGDCHPSFFVGVKKYRQIFAESSKDPGDFPPADALDRRPGTCYAE
jgi:hypothetical protein